MLFEKIKLEEDEPILLMVRRHWFVLFARMLTVVFAAAAPFFILGIASMQTATMGIVDTILTNYSNQVYFLSALWLLLNWTTLAYIWTDHYLDMWIITDRRIIAIDQKSLFVRSIGSFRLERLQDMNIEISGFIATILNYGTIEAQTASGSEEEFRVHNMPNPREIKSLILEAADHRMRSTKTDSL
ncbi:MAG: energy-coupling factor transporter transmembrane protein EcfT [Candidatus Azotimanducaceae bacterium]|jgi:energy-coupling factor transporter transmembrane protein EcfT